MSDTKMLKNLDIQVSSKVDNQSFVGSSGELVRMDTADTRHSSGEDTTSGQPADKKFQSTNTIDEPNIHTIYYIGTNVTLLRVDTFRFQDMAQPKGVRILGGSLQH